MGDYTKNNAKIGTCGRAYYATKSMLEKLIDEPEADYYLKPENSCFFAFPFPQFDLKSIGDISVFHTEERNEFLVQLPNKKGRNSYHQQLVFHKHPAGGAGLNFFCDCPFHNSETASRNFKNDNLKFYLKYETYFRGELTIAGECIYCRELNIFDAEENIEICEELEQRALYFESQKNEAKATEIREIIKRILKN